MTTGAESFQNERTVKNEGADFVHSPHSPTLAQRWGLKKGLTTERIIEVGVPLLCRCGSALSIGGIRLFEVRPSNSQHAPLESVEMRTYGIGTKSANSDSRSYRVLGVLN